MNNNIVSQEEINKIPKLAHGQGSMYVTGDKRYIVYKKTYRVRSIYRAAGRCKKSIRG